MEECYYSASHELTLYGQHIGTLMPIIITDANFGDFHKSNRKSHPPGGRRGLVRLKDSNNDWRFLSIGDANVRITQYGGGSWETITLPRDSEQTRKALRGSSFYPLREVSNLTSLKVKVTYEDANHWLDVINSM